MTQTAKEPQKANITSPDQNAERLAELRRLFPDLFDGEGQIDEQALRQLAQPGSTSMERFRFEWVGKQESKRLAFSPSRATLIADEKRSIDFDDTQNLIIEGDNLEALKLLQATYFEQVKCIYIDPPYNTGNDFIYPDNYAEGKKAYWQRNGIVKDGVKLVANSEANGRKHSNWLNMMQSRLLIARQLLREDGVIFISIDDNEAHHLRKLCDEIFGEENQLVPFIWELPRGINAGHVTRSHEYVIGYAKHKTSLKNFMRSDEGQFSIDRCNKKIDARHPASPITFPAGLRYEGKDQVIKGKIEGAEEIRIIGELKFEDGKLAKPVTLEAGWTMKRMIQDWLDGKEVRDLKGQLIEEFFFKENGRLYSKKVMEYQSQKSLLKGIGDYQDARVELENFFGTQDIFDYPKPSSLVQFITAITTTDDDIIMDFFAGTGPTAHAVMQQNSEDNKQRRFILVQIPEYTDEKHEAYKYGYKTISALCMDRVKKAGEQIKKEHPKSSIDTGFRVYRLTDSHFPENLFKSDPDKSEAENLAALKAHIEKASQSSLFDEFDIADIITEISLKNGYGLFFALEQIKENFGDNKVFRLTGNGKDALLCLEPSLKDEAIETLTAEYTEEQLIVTKRALDTAKTWSLQNAFGDNLRVV